jgi:hypothetical protein
MVNEAAAKGRGRATKKLQFDRDRDFVLVAPPPRVSVGPLAW